jgi:hypothetical protein
MMMMVYNPEEVILHKYKHQPHDKEFHIYNYHSICNCDEVRYGCADFCYRHGNQLKDILAYEQRDRRSLFRKFLDFWDAGEE